jgi:methionyl-tRNA formyltransferase
MDTKALNVVFMGTPDFSVPALNAIAESQHKIIAVYAQPPRPKGRGQHLQKSPVHQRAEELGFPVFTPVSLKKDKLAQDSFVALKADVAIVAAYGLILPKVILDAPRYGCINIHASLLPRWRGASPIQRAVWAGDVESGITIMQMEEGLDTGPMISMQSVSMDHKTTSLSLHDALSTLGGHMIVPVLDRLVESGGLEKTSQDNALSNYAAMLHKDDGRIDWVQSAILIDRQIRALNPWPGVWAMTASGKRLKILSAVPCDDIFGTPGEIMDKQGHVACGSGTGILLKEIQPENAKPMNVQAAMNGGYLEPGTVLV